MQIHIMVSHFFYSCTCRVVDTLKDYAIKAFVNTVDHLGSVTYKVGDMLDEKVDEVSGTELQVSCIEQVFLCLTVIVLFLSGDFSCKEIHTEFLYWFPSG